MNRFLRLASGIAVLLPTLVCALVFVLAFRNPPAALQHYPRVRMFELALIWYTPIVFSFLGAYFLISGAIKSK
jgi:hypothetical protein